MFGHACQTHGAVTLESFECSVARNDAAQLNVNAMMCMNCPFILSYPHGMCVCITASAGECKDCVYSVACM